MSGFKPKGRKRKFIRVENPRKLFKKMTTEHLDVLQNIEFSIVSVYRQDGNIDDKVVASALKTAIAGGDDAGQSSQSLLNALENMRMLRLDISDEIWKNGLKVVLESVYNHSDAQTGDRNYLGFICNFIA